MFTKRVFVGFLFGFLFSSLVLAQAPNGALPEKVLFLKYVTCMTCDDTEKAAKTALLEGKVYSFCDEKCLQTFEKEPSKIIEKMKAAQGVELTLANEKGQCFACAKPAVSPFFKTTESKIAFFCSAECREKTKNDHTGHDHEKDSHKDASEAKSEPK